MSTVYSHCQQKLAGSPQESSKFTRTYLWSTLRTLLVDSSDKLGGHTFPRRMTQVSDPVSVPIRGRLCHLVFLHIFVCKILVSPSLSQSSDVFGVAVCVWSSSSSCWQMHLHHGQGWQTVWENSCNDEQRPRGAFLRRERVWHSIRGIGYGYVVVGLPTS